MNFFYAIFTTICAMAHTNAVAIISRSEWNARASTSRLSPLRQNPAPFVVIHHSNTSSCLSTQDCKARVRQIQSYHIDHNGWSDIGYNFLIGGDGLIYEGRGWGKTGAHSPNYNSKSIGICLIGDFQHKSPNQNQLDALESLLKSSSGKVTSNYKLVGHRQTKSTTCPGDFLFNIISQWDHFDPTVHP